MAQGEAILVKDLPTDVVEATANRTKESGVPQESNEAAGSPDALDAAYAYLRSENENDLLKVMEGAMLSRVLKETNGDLGSAAKILGMTRPTLRKRMDQHGLSA